MNAAKAPGAPRQHPLRIPLGTYTDQGGEYEAQLVVTSSRLANLIMQARQNRDGRAVVASGGIAVLVKRVKPPAEASLPAEPSGGRR